MDMLEEIFKKQKELQVKLGVVDKYKIDDSMKQQYINQMCLALHEESVEIMRESAYKNPDFMPFGWKKNQTFNTENFKKEIVDLMHFLVNLCLVVDMTPKEFYELYTEKNKENHVRKDTNY